MASTDLSSLSEEELDAIIKGETPSAVNAPPGRGAEENAARNKRAAAIAQKEAPTAEQIEPSAIKRGLAAMGGVLQEPVIGAAEKMQLAFPGTTPEAANATRQQIGEDRAGRRGAMEQLTATPAGNIGAFGGEMVKTLPFGTSAGAQAAGAGLMGFLGGGAEKPTGVVNELATSGASGGINALMTGLGVKGMETAGKGINAARGRMTPEGIKAMSLDDAAARMNVPAPTIGQLRGKPGPDELTAQQGVALESRLSGTREVPNPAGGMETQTVPGGRMQEAAVEAIKARQGQAKEMYNAVDQFAAANNLNPVSPNYTVNSLQALNKLTPTGKAPTGNNLAYNLLDHYDPDAFSWLKAAGSPQAAKQSGMTMTQYHDSRVAVGKAINQIDRIPPAQRTADQQEAYRGLLDVKAALDNDAERWARQNAGNGEAMALYNRAKDFYSTVAAPATTSNPLARKFQSVTKGFQSPEQMYNAVLNPTNATLMDRLLPTMSPEGQDLFSVFRGLPDVGKTVATRARPEAQRGQGGLSQALRPIAHPVSALAEAAPGLQWLSSRRPTKKLYFAENPLEGKVGKPLAAAAQYPAQEGEDWANQRLARPR